MATLHKDSHNLWYVPGTVWDDTIGGFNTWLENQQKVAGVDQKLTLTMFDTVVATPYVETPIADVKPLTKLTYIPGGNTALLDAIGLTAKKVQDADKTQPVLVVILTDGHENSSHEYTKQAIQELVAAKQADGWEFVYIGTDAAGFDDTATMGYGTTRMASGMGQSLYVNLGHSTQTYASTSLRGASMDSMLATDPNAPAGTVVADPKKKGTK